jgi:hypothetical protein
MNSYESRMKTTPSTPNKLDKILFKNFKSPKVNTHPTSVHTPHNPTSNPVDAPDLSEAKSGVVDCPNR